MNVAPASTTVSFLQWKVSALPQFAELPQALLVDLVSNRDDVRELVFFCRNLSRLRQLFEIFE